MLKAIPMMKSEQQEKSDLQINAAVCRLIESFTSAYLDVQNAIEFEDDPFNPVMSLSHEAIAYVAVELIKLAVMAEGEI